MISLLQDISTRLATMKTGSIGIRKRISFIICIFVLLNIFAAYQGIIPATSTTISDPTNLHPPFRKAWELSVGDTIIDAAFSKDAIYFGTYESYGAIDLKTGKFLWTRNFPKKYFGAHIACQGNILFVSIGEWRTLACDGRTGDELWSEPLKGYSGPMLASDRRLFCELPDGVLTIIDTQTFDVLWIMDLETGKKAGSRDLGIAGTPVIYDDRLFVGTFAGEVLCLNPQTGQIIWKHQITTGDEPMITGISVDNDYVCYSLFQGPIVMLDINTGKQLWNFGSPSQTNGAPVLYRGNMFFASIYRKIVAVGAANGRKLWEKPLSGTGNTVTSPAKLSGEQIITGAGTSITAFDPAGKQEWAFDIDDNMFGQPIIISDDGFIVRYESTIQRYICGEPDSKKLMDMRGKDLAETLVSRFDRLTDADEKKLISLGDDAFRALLPAVQDRLRRFEDNIAAGLEDAEEPYERGDETLSSMCMIMRDVTTRKHTPELINVWRSAKTPEGREPIMGIIGAKGDSSMIIPSLLDALKMHKPGHNHLESENDYIGLDIIARSTDPRAIRFLIDELKAPQGDPIIKREAFLNLARTGGKEGIKAVIAAMNKDRKIPSMGSFLRLDVIPEQIETADKDGFKWEWDSPVHFLKIQKDDNGISWGLISTPIMGSLDDLWIIMHDGRKWTSPLFTGSTSARLGKGDWFAEFVGNCALAVDSDGDGWTDLIELRLGTDPRKRDTDSDGLEDSKDKNPLAKLRKLTDSESVLAAAFQAMYQFSGGRGNPCLVELPKGMKKMEFLGWDWVTFTQEHGQKSTLNSYIGKGIAKISFAAPFYDFNGKRIKASKSDSAILWNKTRTEAKLQVQTMYGGLDGTGYDVHVKRFGTEWVVIKVDHAWIS
ncbi:MAG: PQQ-binding-like beta-propeller repeat protein [Armatimonadota bacterium]